MVVEGKGRRIVFLAVFGHPFHRTECVAKTADSAAESDADACPDSPDTHAAALVQPDAQKNEAGQRKRNRKPQLCQPDQ